MNRDINIIVDKIRYISMRVNLSQKIGSSLIDDYQKRILLRGLFLDIDSFLKLSPRLNNALAKEKTISLQDRDLIKKLISKLEKDYSTFYDKIRDSFTAHRLPLDLLELYTVWNEIDEITVKVFIDSILEIANKLLISFGGFNWESINSEDIDQLVIDLNNKLTHDGKFKASSDALALARKNTIGIIPCSPMQEKMARLMSLIDVMNNLCQISQVTRNYPIAHELIWAMLINDAFSIIDNLFIDRVDDESLMSHWNKIEIEGYKHLCDVNKSRKSNFEDMLRKVRNHFCAHIDSKMTLQNIRIEYYESKQVKFVKYVQKLAAGFIESCRLDIRTQVFLIHNVELNGVLDVEKAFYKLYEK